MPANNINVSLAKDGSKNLDVQDHGATHIDKHPNPSTITWHLINEAAQGKFVAMDCAEPGFSWFTKEPPPEHDKGGPFEPATVINNGNAVTITDNHSSQQSDGQWIYILRVDMGAKGIYTTTTSLDPRAGINDPIIINR